MKLASDWLLMALKNTDDNTVDLFLYIYQNAIEHICLSKIYNGYSIVEQIDTKEEEIRKIGALGLPAPYEAFCDQYVGYNRERFDQLVNGIGLGERMMFSI